MQQNFGGKVNFVLMRYYFSTPEAFIFSIWLIITLVYDLTFIDQAFLIIMLF